MPQVPVGAGRDPFYRLVQAGFRQRRKQLHNALGRELPVPRSTLSEAFAACGVDSGSPAQTLSLAEWACLHGPASPTARRSRAAQRVMPSAALSLEAPAKLNLSLRVVGRRPDGFHLLETEMVLLDLADRLLLLPRRHRPAGRGRDRRRDTARCQQPRLAWPGRASAASADLACLALEKRIPVAAGLGGGSSDAAAAWRLGRRAAEAAETATPDDLASLSLLGADVPFFAAAVAAAVVTGIGEMVTPLANRRRRPT